MTEVCRATKRNGEPCTLPAANSSEYCWAHDPAFADRRHRAASKAAKSKGGNTEIRSIKEQLQGIATRVLNGELDTRAATAATQALNCLLRGIEIESRLTELKEIESQLAALESRATLKIGGC